MIVELKDKTVFSIKDNSSIYSLILSATSLDDVATFLPKLTNENLSDINIYDGEDQIGHFENFSLSYISFRTGYVLNLIAIGTEDNPSIIERRDPIADDKAAGYDILIGEAE